MTLMVQDMKVKQMMFIHFFYKNKDMFDSSKYLKNLKYYDATNKKVIGKIKDETKHTPIIQFARLKTKIFIKHL